MASKSLDIVRLDTSKMNTKKVFDYLAKQRAAGFPGSYSITRRPLSDHLKRNVVANPYVNRD